MILHVRNIVSSKTGEALVDLILQETPKVERPIAQMTVEQARDHAKAVMECAEAAEQDAFLVHFARDVLAKDLTEEEKQGCAANLVNDFRKWRSVYGSLKS